MLLREKLEEVIQSNLDLNVSQELETSIVSVKMDDAEYRANMRKAKIHCRRVITAVKIFAPDDITSILDWDNFQENLWQIKDKFLQVTTWVDALVVELEENKKSARITELEARIGKV